MKSQPPNQHPGWAQLPPLPPKKQLHPPDPEYEVMIDRLLEEHFKSAIGEQLPAKR